MLKSYWITAWRNMMRTKGYSTLNVLGLALGMAVALLIGLWVHYEYSYDKFLPGYQQLYQVRRNFNSNGDILTFKTTSLKLADALRRDVPEIDGVVESDWMDAHGLMVGDKKFYIPGAQINGNFLELFGYPLLKGNPGTVLKDPYSIVLTESTAKILFGNTDVINKTVRFDNKDDLKVTGVLKDVPGNSTLKFGFLVPFAYLEKTDKDVRENRTGSFGANGYQLFVRVRQGIDYAQVAARIKNIEKTEKDNVNSMHSEVILQPMHEWHLYDNYENGKAAGGFIDYIRLFTIIGVLVLAIAGINFVNLTTARSEKRAREVGVRKAIGSQRKDLILQFLIESTLVTLIAFGVSLLLVQTALPAFNSLTGSEVSIPVSSALFWAVTLGCVLVTALAAGSRPAFYLSSFDPVRVLKGSIKLGKAATWPRKVLVVVQFSCSIALVISTIIVYRQIAYVKDRPVGYSMNRLMMTEMNGDLNHNYEALKNEMIREGIVEHVTQSSSPVTGIYWHSNLDDWPGKEGAETVEMGIIQVTGDYFATLGMPIVQGRDFAGPSDTTCVIFNEAAIKRLRIQHPVNQVMTLYGMRLRVVGVAKDALMASPYSPAEPTMFVFKADAQHVMTYRLSPHIGTADAIARLTALFNKYAPAYPYAYRFVDQSYAAKFDLEVLVGKLAGLFAGLAIIISCLGLLGLAAYMAEQRTKEMGIRKVLGASVPQVWMLLSRDFVVLVMISCMIASPLALYFLQNWLRQYAYRVEIGIAPFVWSALIAIGITVLTVSVQSVKAAMANPVRSLKAE
jgi:ABC-type antimicrobial peptide transport system permease subunit